MHQAGLSKRFNVDIVALNALPLTVADPDALAKEPGFAAPYDPVVYTMNRKFSLDDGASADYFLWHELLPPGSYSLGASSCSFVS